MRDNQDEIIAVAESEIPRGLRHAGSWSDKDECDGSVLWVGSEWTAHGSEVETISADGGEWIYATGTSCGHGDVATSRAGFRQRSTVPGKTLSLHLNVPPATQMNRNPSKV
jgi:hypothetical protein